MGGFGGVWASAEKLEETLNSVFTNYGLCSAARDRIIKKHCRRSRTGRYCPVTLHIPCEDQEGESRHLRVLLRENQAWRRIRRTAIRRHRDLWLLTENHECGFRTPALVASGASPLLWDLSVKIEADKLPWHNYSSHTLDALLHRADSLIDLNLKVQKLTLRRIPRVSRDVFSKVFTALIRESLRTGLLKEREAQRFECVWNSWLETPVSVSDQVLCHGDFNPSNVLFGSDKDYIIDWDYLRYSYPADSFTRLWMFVSGDPPFQQHIEHRLKAIFRSPRFWAEFHAFALLHVLQQCRIEFRVARVAEGGLQALEKKHFRGFRAVVRYLSALDALPSRLEMLGVEPCVI